jgi:hypothetical protein
MVRVSFFYSDFLGTGTPPPTFRLEIEVEYAGLINSLQDPEVFYEVMLSATRDNICVCLARSTTTDVPFVSALELRALDTASMYTVVQQGVYLYNSFRQNLGTITDSPLRYVHHHQIFQSSPSHYHGPLLVLVLVLVLLLNTLLSQTDEQQL